MTKCSLCLLLAGAFLYAGWLVLRRRTPDAAGLRAERRVFILMTLYFMAWMGVPVLGGDAGADSQAAVAGVDNMQVSEALRSSWAVLGMLNRHYLVEALGTEEELAEYAVDKARDDEADRVFWEKAGELYQKMRKLEFCDECAREQRYYRNECEHETPEQREDRLARHAAVKEEFERDGEPYLAATRKTGDVMSKKWWTMAGDSERKYLDRNRDRFAAALQSECERGKIGSRAVEMALSAYDAMEYHQRRVQATCYMGLPPEYHQRQAIGENVRSLSVLSGDAQDAVKIARAEREIADALAGLRRVRYVYEYIEEHPGAPLYLVPVGERKKGEWYSEERLSLDGSEREIAGYRDSEGADEAIDEKMRDPELKAAIDEAARLIVELSRNASPEWGKRQKGIPPRAGR